MKIFTRQFGLSYFSCRIDIGLENATVVQKFILLFKSKLLPKYSNSHYFTHFRSGDWIGVLSFIRFAYYDMFALFKSALINGIL